MPDTDTRRAARRPRIDATAQAGRPGAPPLPDAREDAVQRLRYAYATGKLPLGELLDALEATTPAGLARLTESLPAVPPRTGPRGGTHRTYPADMALLARLAAISDPRGRLVSAAAAADAAKAEQETARQHRLRALVTAHARYGVPQVRCYEPYGGISARRPFRRDLRQYQATLPTYGDDELNRRAAEVSAEIAGLPAGADSEQGADAAGGRLADLTAELTAIKDKLGGAAIAEADAWHARYETARSTAETARLVRDREIRALSEGGYGGEPVKNAELAKLTGYFTARIAQIRNGPVTV